MYCTLLYNTVMISSQITEKVLQNWCSIWRYASGVAKIIRVWRERGDGIVRKESGKNLITLNLAALKESRTLQRQN